MNLIECLMKTGLTKSESELYLALSREGELTGYEAAKLTGIPRANAYQALAALVDKGGAYVVDGTVQRYTAVPVDEYTQNVMSHMKETVETIRRDCPVGKSPLEPYITITGFSHIADKVKNMVTGAKERIYISLSGQELPFLQGELEAAVMRSLKVVVIASREFQLSGAEVYRINEKSGQMRLIADSSHVLTGSVSGNGSDICLYSKNKPLVELIKDSLKNEIRLSQLEGGNNL